jgi:hypothetical protein
MLSGLRTSYLSIYRWGHSSWCLEIWEANSVIPDTHQVCFVQWGFADSTSVMRICTFGIQIRWIAPDSQARGRPRKRRSVGGGNKLDALLNFTFMLPCIVIDFFLNNQPDALIIPILFCYKSLHVSGIFSAHHQEFSPVHSALKFHPDSAWKRSLEICMKLTSTECTVGNSWRWAEKMLETCRVL